MSSLKTTIFDTLVNIIVVVQVRAFSVSDETRGIISLTYAGHPTHIFPTIFEALAKSLVIKARYVSQQVCRHSINVSNSKLSFLNRKTIDDKSAAAEQRKARCAYGRKRCAIHSKSTERFGPCRSRSENGQSYTTRKGWDFVVWISSSFSSQDPLL